MRSKRQSKTGTIQLRKNAGRKIKRHLVDRTVKRQSSGAILADLKHRLSEIYDLNAAGSVLTWDQATYMPNGGAVSRGRQSALLRRLAHERFVDPALGKLMDRLQPCADKLAADDASLIRVARRDYERAIRVPAEYVARANAHYSGSYNAWIRARPANDFASMIPFLEKTLDLSREYASFFAPYDNIADPMIDDADMGLTTAAIQGVFAELRRELHPLVRGSGRRPPQARQRGRLDRAAGWTLDLETGSASAHNPGNFLRIVLGIGA
jgi:carboxypeptidase Taq